MILATSRDMDPDDCDIVTAQMIKGFNDTAREAGTSVTGGQTIRNPWPIIGGVASSTVMEHEMIRPEGATANDILVLTKPLGTQVIVNLWQRRKEYPDGWRWPALRAAGITFSDIGKPYDIAVRQMSRLNKNAAVLMHKYGAKASTDVTGFGILGHLDNLARHTDMKGLLFEIDRFPAICGLMDADEAMGGAFRLKKGTAAETSGGLLIAFPDVQAATDFINEYSEATYQDDLTRGFTEELEEVPTCAWIVGKVVNNPDGDSKVNQVQIREDAEIINVTY